MKKQFILFLFLLPFVTVGAKTVHKVVKPTYVGINDGTMAINSVKTTEDATTVTFQYTGEGLGFFSSKIHLVDEQGRHYKLIGQKGFEEDSLKQLLPKKKGKYELHFSPLPAETRIFDMIEDAYYMGSTKYYGIREKDTPFTVSNPLPHNEGESSLPDIDFKADSTIVTGHIVNYNPENTDTKGIYRLHYSFNFDDKTPSVQFDEEGNFQMKLFTYGPTWTYLVMIPSGMFIPVMLYPGDSIHLQIDLEADNRITYNSRMQKDFSKLMQCAPIIPTFHNVRYKDTTYYNRMTPESVQKRFEDYDAMGLYLSGKYGLSRVETEMLRADLSVTAAIDVVAITAYYQNKKYPYPTTSKEEWLQIKGESPYFGCISNVRAESNAFLTTPNWSDLLHTHYLFDNPKFYVLFDDILKKGHLSTSGKPFTVGDMFNPALELMRGYREKGDKDAIFEQAYLLCLLRTMPFNIQPFDNHMVYLYNHFNQYRQLFYHPSFVRMVEPLIDKWEQKAYQELEEQEKSNRLSNKQ